MKPVTEHALFSALTVTNFKIPCAVFTFISTVFAFVSTVFTFVSTVFTFVSTVFTFVSTVFTFVWAINIYRAPNSQCLIHLPSLSPFLPSANKGDVNEERREIAAYSGRQLNLQSVNRFTPTPRHTGATASHPSSLGPTASQALALFCDCLENGMSAMLVMRSARGGNNISFTCRELNSSAATAEQGKKKRPAIVPKSVRRTRGGEKSG